MQWPEEITVCEVGPRDGFQMEEAWIPTDVKVEVINQLSRTGLRRIQATSFVHPRAIPQLRDAEEVMDRIDRVPGVRYSALVPNERGVERAIAARADAVDMVVSVSESHCHSNTNMTTAQAMERAQGAARLAREAGLVMGIGFPVALGCPFEGFPPYDRVEGLVVRAVEEFGLTQVTIPDTVGMANPTLVHTTMSRLIHRCPGATFALHLHNTRGMGLANVVAGLDAGVRQFDSAVAGLGGCPFAPGATGNIATEDLVHMLEEMGVRTSVDLEAVLRVARRVEEAVGHADSAVLRAGMSRQLLGVRPRDSSEADRSLRTTQRRRAPVRIPPTMWCTGVRTPRRLGIERLPGQTIRTVSPYRSSNTRRRRMGKTILGPRGRVWRSATGRRNTGPPITTRGGRTRSGMAVDSWHREAADRTLIHPGDSQHEILTQMPPHQLKADRESLVAQTTRHRDRGMPVTLTSSSWQGAGPSFRGSRPPRAMSRCRVVWR